MILKISESTYAQSLARFHQSYQEGFPQREKFLFEAMKAQGTDFGFFTHPALSGKFRRVVTSALDLQEVLLNESKNIDAIVVDNPFSALVLREIEEHLSVKNLDIPVIFDFIDQYEKMYVTEFGADEGYYLLRTGLEWLYRNANKVVFQSPLLMEEEGRNFKTDQENQIAIPNGYQRDMFLKHWSSEWSPEYVSSYKYGTEVFNASQPVSSSLMLPRGKKLVVFCGKLGKWYRELQQICKGVSESDDLFFLIVGDGPDKELYSRYKNCRVTGRVPLDHIPMYLKLADVLVFPVDDDSPIATSEYLTSDKPIVHYGNRIKWLLGDERPGIYYVQDACSEQARAGVWVSVIQKAINYGHAPASGYGREILDLGWDTLSKEFTDFISKPQVL